MVLESMYVCVCVCVCIQAYVLTRMHIGCINGAVKDTYIYIHIHQVAQHAAVRLPEYLEKESW